MVDFGALIGSLDIGSVWYYRFRDGSRGVFLDMYPNTVGLVPVISRLRERKRDAFYVEHGFGENSYMVYLSEREFLDFVSRGLGLMDGFLSGGERDVIAYYVKDEGVSVGYRVLGGDYVGVSSGLRGICERSRALNLWYKYLLSRGGYIC